MEQKRFVNIDICKGILMLIVIVNHGLAMTSLNENYFHCWNTAVAMPGFFILSGLMYNHEKWSRLGFRAFFLHRFQTLLIPYVFFDLTGGALVQIVLGHWSGLNVRGLLWECMILLKKTLTISCNLNPDWFLPTLFFAELLLYAACKVTQRSNKIIYGLAAAALALCALYVRLQLPTGRLNGMIMRASRILLAFAFLAVGRTGNGLFLRMPYQLRHVALALCLVCLEPLVNGRSLMFTMDIPYVSFFSFPAVPARSSFSRFVPRSKAGR